MGCWRLSYKYRAYRVGRLLYACRDTTASYSTFKWDWRVCFCADSLLLRVQGRLEPIRFGRSDFGQIS